MKISLAHFTFFSPLMLVATLCAQEPATTPKITATVTATAAEATPAPAPEREGEGATLSDAEKAYVAKMDASLAANPEDLEKVALHFKRGKFYYEKHIEDKAFDDFNAVLKLDPDHGYAHTLRGDVYLHRHEYGKALADFDEVIRLEPHNYKVMGNRGIAYEGLKDLDKAIEAFTQSITVKPDFAPIYERRAYDYFQKGDKEKAMADYNEAIRLDSKRGRGYAGRALLYFDNGDFVKGKEDLTHAVENDPRPDELNNLAWMLATSTNAEIRDGKKAVDYAKKACELSNWKRPHIIDTLAAAYAEAGDFENAVKYEQQFIETPGMGQPDIDRATEILTLYKAKKPYREGE